MKGSLCSTPLHNPVLLIIKHYYKKKKKKNKRREQQQKKNKTKKPLKSLSSPQKIPSILSVDEYLGKQEDKVSTDKLPSQSIHV